MNRFLLSISLLALAAGSALAMAPFAQAADAKSTFSVLYTFTGGNDGARPLSGLISDNSGNLYGTAYEGGANNLGTLFELAPDGTETPLITFNSGNGQSPCRGFLIEDESGNLFGTTGAGGEYDRGAVYTLALADETEQVLYSFDSDSDGYNIEYGLLKDKSGNLYGTAYQGGSNSAGEVYEVTGGTKTTIWAFCSQANCADGFGPLSQLIRDKHGNLYGTTVEGGMYGYGTVFKLSPPAKGQTQWTETLVHSFAATVNGTIDGCYPFAGVIADKSGNLYGTTYGCGGYTNGNSDGDGSVFKIAADGTESLLYGFSGGNDGMNPEAPLIEDKYGNLYGTATAGGAENDGSVFKIAPDGTETILYTFTGGSDGAAPFAPLHRKGSWLYGTASAGGAGGHGTVFKVKD